MNGRDDVDPNKLNDKGCEYGRGLRKDFLNFKCNIEGDVEDMEKDVVKIVDNLQGRPSWAVSIIITLMTSTIVGMTILLMGG